MKIFLGFFLVVVLMSSTSYWYGAKVGMQQKELNTLAVKAHNIGLNLDPHEGNENEYIESEIDNLLIQFGWYLEERLPFMPGYRGLEESSLDMFQQIALYRLTKPRVIDGVEYYPYKKNWKKEIINIDIGGKPLEPEYIESKILETERNENRFKNALKYFNERKTYQAAAL